MALPDGLLAPAAGQEGQTHTTTKTRCWTGRGATGRRRVGKVQTVQHVASRQGRLRTAPWRRGPADSLAPLPWPPVHPQHSAMPCRAAAVPSPSPHSLSRSLQEARHHPGGSPSPRSRSSCCLTLLFLLKISEIPGSPGSCTIASSSREPGEGGCSAEGKAVQHACLKRQGPLSCSWHIQEEEISRP